MKIKIRGAGGVVAAQGRKQFEMFTEQSQRLTSLAQKAATDAAQPLQSEVAKTFKKNA